MKPRSSAWARRASAVVAVPLLLSLALGTGVPTANAAFDGASSVSAAERGVAERQPAADTGDVTGTTKGGQSTGVTDAAAADATAAAVAGLTLARVPGDPDAKEGEPAGENARAETAAPGARVRPVAVKVVVDDSYRRHFPHWRQKVKDMVERADNRLADVYGIDLTVTSTARWRIGDPGGCGAWLNRLRRVDRGGADFVIGVTYNGYGDAGGCAYLLGRVMTVQRQGDRADWIVTRHEVSHVYGAHDRYIRSAGDNPNHRNDLMEDAYRHPHIWSNEPGDGDRQIIRRHSERFN